MKQPQKKLIFVGGTGTNVGKTVLSCLLLEALREFGFKVVGFKPFCSGGREDARYLQRFSSPGFSLDEINPWHFDEPVAPAWAAEKRGVHVDLSQLEQKRWELSSKVDWMVVEGAGGLMSPLFGNKDSLDVLVKWRPSRVLMVSSDELGVINQVRLCHHALLSHGLKEIRWVLMQKRRPDASVEGNYSILTQNFGIKPMAKLEYLKCKPLMCNGLKIFNKKNKKRVALTLGIDSFLSSFEGNREVESRKKRPKKTG